MNQLSAVIKSMETEEAISVVIAAAAGMEWHIMVIDNAQTNSHLQEGKTLTLVFKESAVSIAKNVIGKFSIRNRMECAITEIKEGKVLSEIVLDSKGQTITSVITTNAVKELNLQKGDVVEALVKTTDISLMQPES